MTIDQQSEKITRRLRREEAPKFAHLKQQMRFGRWKSTYGLVKMALTHFKPGSVGLEIGSFAGESALIFMETVDALTLFCVDPWESVAEGKSYHAKLVQARECFESVVLKRYERVAAIRQTADVALSSDRENFFDWAYIDGGHSEEEVFRDIKLVLPLVKPGGIIAGHDYGRPNLHPGVTLAVDKAFGKPHHVYEDSSWVARNAKVEHE